MSHHDDRDAQELSDAARVHAVHEDVVRAIADLAASPLSERAADRMRRVLERSTTRPVRDAVTRIAAGSDPRKGRARMLSAVPRDDGERTAAGPIGTVSGPGIEPAAELAQVTQAQVARVAEIRVAGGGM